MAAEGPAPAERLSSRGPVALSDAELVALLLGRGQTASAAVARAQRLLRSLGGLAALAAAARQGQLRQEDLEPADAVRLGSAAELARRLARAELPERPGPGDAQEVVRCLYVDFFVADQEVLGAVFLGLKGRLLAAEEIFRGTLSRIAVEPRAILKRALLLGAAQVIAFHTHPSGDPTPSAEDLAFTRRLAKACEMMSVTLNDHLIIGGPRRWMSLKERRLF
jgi:DNA repair protein RadC